MTMVRRMTELGYQTIYSGAGPKILHLLLIGSVLNRLYLTHATLLLGGQPYASFVEGPLLDPEANLKLLIWNSGCLTVTWLKRIKSQVRQKHNTKGLPINPPGVGCFDKR
jgi:riboflavin biosynthesis pyrimidine reductase